MRLGKVLLSIFFVTFIALVYVYQQSEIFYLAYLSGKKQEVLTQLLDKNNIFRYNINKSSSLTCLEDKLLGSVDFEMPAMKQLVRLNPEEENLKSRSESARITNVILSFFTRARQAQAQTLNR